MRFSLSPHVAVKVKDYGNAVPFYRDVLGMQVRKVTPGEAELGCGPMTFHVEDSPDGHVCFEFRVPDAAEARRVLTEAGCTITKEHSARSFLVADPFGLHFHVFD